MNKPFQKPSVKKPPHVKKFIPWIYTSSCGAANTQLFECLFTGVQDLPSGPPRLSGRPAFGRPPSEASEVPREGPATPVNSIHSWVFSVTALGAVVSRKKLFLSIFVQCVGQQQSCITDQNWSWVSRSNQFFAWALKKVQIKVHAWT